jgi:hypothetical protein
MVLFMFGKSRTSNWYFDTKQVLKECEYISYLYTIFQIWDFFELRFPHVCWFGRAVSCLRWVTLGGAHYCLVGTNDGILLSLDINGDINASKYLGVANAVRSIDITGNLLLGSLDDKSMRGWIFDPVGGKLVDALNMSSFHGSAGISALCSISIAKSKSVVLITGGDMGHLRVSLISGLD